MDIELLTVEQILELLHVSRMTLWREMKAGKITYVKVGTRVLFRKSDIDRWIKSHLVK